MSVPTGWQVVDRAATATEIATAIASFNCGANINRGILRAALVKSSNNTVGEMKIKSEDLTFSHKELSQWHFPPVRTLQIDTPAFSVSYARLAEMTRLELLQYSIGVTEGLRRIIDRTNLTDGGFTDGRFYGTYRDMPLGLDMMSVSRRSKYNDSFTLPKRTIPFEYEDDPVGAGAAPYPAEQEAKDDDRWATLRAFDGQHRGYTHPPPFPISRDDPPHIPL